MHQAPLIFKSNIRSDASASSVPCLQKQSLRGAREVENALSFRSAGHESLDAKTSTGPHEKPHSPLSKNRGM